MKKLSDKELDSIFFLPFNHQTNTKYRLCFASHKNELLIYILDSEETYLDIEKLYAVKYVGGSVEALEEEHMSLESFKKTKPFLLRNKDVLYRIHQEFLEGDDINNIPNKLRELR